MKLEKPARSGTRTYDRQQRVLAQQVLSLLCLNDRKFYASQFQEIGSLANGSFIGLACKCCNRWLGYGHDDDCPGPRISQKDIDAYKAAIRSCRTVQRTDDGDIAGKDFAY
jgi:hypothetical protein